MKKSLLALSAAAIALSGMAASPKQMLQAPVKPSFSTGGDIKPLGKLHVADRNASMKKAPAKAASAADVITSAEGDVQNVTINGSGYYLWYGMFLDFYENQDIASHVVYGENNEVYVYDMIPNFTNNSYVKGVKEGDKVVFEFPQTVYWDEEYGDGYDLTLFNIYEYVNEDGENSATYLPVEGKCTLSFTVGADGTLTTDELSDAKMLGAGLNSQGDGWIGYGAIDLTIIPFTEEAVSIPDDYGLSENFWAYNAGDYGWPVSWAQGGEDVYFKGLTREMPEACVKGTVEYDDSEAVISIAQGQYLGTYAGYYIYTLCAKLSIDEEGYEYYELMPEDYKYELVWNYEDETIVAKDPEVALLFNASKTDILYLNEYLDMKLVHQESFAGVPQNPYGLEYAEGSNYNEFYFFVPGLSTEGDVLNPEYLSYVVYVDGEEWTFEPDDYDTEEPIDEVPWDLSLYYIYNWGGTEREVDFFVEGITTLGVQSIYRYNGEETRSEIVSIDLDPSAVAPISADKKVASVKYYDLNGREVAKSASGILVKKVTFEDGTVATFKKAVR